jgi:transcriptional regulator of NAD metabolism
MLSRKESIQSYVLFDAIIEHKVSLVDDCLKIANRNSDRETLLKKLKKLKALLISEDLGRDLIRAEKESKIFNRFANRKPSVK